MAFFELLTLVFSLAVLSKASTIVVDNLVKLSKFFGISKIAIGFILLAVSTSLPELSIDLQAIRKRHYGIALGDAIGSNMANITLVLGVAAVINPISVLLPVFIAALLFAIVANVVLFYVAAVKGRLERTGGFLFLLIYAVYIITIFFLQVGELSQA